MDRKKKCTASTYTFLLRDFHSFSRNHLNSPGTSCSDPACLPSFVFCHCPVEIPHSSDSAQTVFFRTFICAFTFSILINCNVLYINILSIQYHLSLMYSLKLSQTVPLPLQSLSSHVCNHGTSSMHVPGPHLSYCSATLALLVYSHCGKS